MLYLLDASAIINNPSFIFSPNKKYLTTPEVMNEFKDFRSRNLAENALKNQILKLKEPDKKFISKVEKKLKEMNMHLSAEDVSLLALAEELKSKKMKFILITDDFSMQNYCKLNKIKFEFSAMGKIKKAIKKF